MPAARAPQAWELSRRALLGLAATAALAGCGSPASIRTRPAEGVTRHPYGSDDAQFAELRMPLGDSVATVVLLHGGYWYPQYGLELMRPIASQLNQLGYAT